MRTAGAPPGCRAPADLRGRRRATLTASRLLPETAVARPVPGGLRRSRSRLISGNARDRVPQGGGATQDNGIRCLRARHMRNSFRRAVPTAGGCWSDGCCFSCWRHWSPSPAGCWRRPVWQSLVDDQRLKFQPGAAGANVFEQHEEPRMPADNTVAHMAQTIVISQ